MVFPWPLHDSDSNSLPLGLDPSEWPTLDLVHHNSVSVLENDEEPLTYMHDVPVHDEEIAFQVRSSNSKMLYMPELNSNNSKILFVGD